jgi:hypothetical protein
MVKIGGVKEISPSSIMGRFDVVPQLSPRGWELSV